MVILATLVLILVCANDGNTDVYVVSRTHASIYYTHVCVHIHMSAFTVAMYDVILGAPILDLACLCGTAVTVAPNQSAVAVCCIAYVSEA